MRQKRARTSSQPRRFAASAVGVFNVFFVLAAVLMAFAVLVRPAFTQWKELPAELHRPGGAESEPYAFLATELHEYHQVYEVREEYKRLRRAYHQRLQTEPPGGERWLLNRWETREPDSLRYKITFDYCYGFAY